MRSPGSFTIGAAGSASACREKILLKNPTTTPPFYLSHGEYIFLEKYLKLKREERDNVFDFIMDVCSAIGDSGVSGTAVAQVEFISQRI